MKNKRMYKISPVCAYLVSEICTSTLKQRKNFWSKEIKRFKLPKSEQRLIQKALDGKIK